MSKPTEKLLYEQHGKCPWCSKLIHTRVVRVTTTPGVAAQTSIEGFIEKDKQTTLEQDYQNEYSPAKKRGRLKK